jgi:hypothetical protein
MTYMPTLRDSIIKRRSTLLQLTPTEFATIKPDYELSGESTLLSIVDRVSNDAPSLGPDAFDDDTLTQAVAGAAVIVLSTQLGEREEQLLAVIVARASKFVLVRTEPQHHYAWARRLVDLEETGSVGVMHIATDATMKGLLSRLEQPNPIKKEFVN